MRFASFEDLTSFVWEARGNAAPIPYRHILQRLCDEKVDFILAGGVAVSLMGAPVCTFDLELVYSTGEEHLQRLMHVREEFAAYAGHLNFAGVIGEGRTYANLLPDTVKVQIGS